MTRPSFFILVALFFLASITAVPAADKDGSYAVLGNQSCHAYNQARTADDAKIFKFYVMGYLTAFNTIMDDTYSISGNKPLIEVMEWFDTYCGDHGVHSFEMALRNFIASSYDDRMQRSSEYSFRGPPQ